MEDKNVYVKRGRKYEPIGYWWSGQNDWLSEGVWVVRKRPGVTGTTSGDYLKTMFGIDKVSNLVDVSFAELGGLENLTDEILHRWPSGWYDEPHSHYETIAKVVGIIKQIQDENSKKETKESSKNEHLVESPF